MDLLAPYGRRIGKPCCSSVSILSREWRAREIPRRAVGNSRVGEQSPQSSEETDHPLHPQVLGRAICFASEWVTPSCALDAQAVDLIREPAAAARPSELSRVGERGRRIVRSFFC